MSVKRSMVVYLSVGIIATMLLLSPHVTFAQGTLSDLDPLHGATAYDVVRNVITAFLGMVGALALGVFIYAGVTWMTAGSSDRVQKAKDAMKYAVIGLALIAFAYAITTFFINSLTGGIQAQSQAQQKAAATPPAVNP